jgi:hypothetical protein
MSDSQPTPCSNCLSEQLQIPEEDAYGATTSLILELLLGLE